MYSDRWRATCWECTVVVGGWWLVGGGWRAGVWWVVGVVGVGVVRLYL